MKESENATSHICMSYDYYQLPFLGARVLEERRKRPDTSTGTTSCSYA